MFSAPSSQYGNDDNGPIGEGVNLTDYGSACCAWTERNGHRKGRIGIKKNMDKSELMATMVISYLGRRNGRSWDRLAKRSYSLD